MPTTKKAPTRTLDPIPLFTIKPPAEPKVVPGKLRLSLRTTELSEELKGIPRSIAQLHERILHCRQLQLEAVYQGVLAYLKILGEDPKFYRRFNCGTIDEYHVKYGVGSGAALAKLIALVKWFEQETFVLVGDQLLNEMILKLVTVQSNTGLRKRDIGRIFERYCAQHERFDRETFRITVRQYIDETYPPKKVRVIATSKEELVRSLGGSWPETKPLDGPPRRVRLEPATTSTKVLVVGGAEETDGSHRLVEVSCTGCDLRDRIIREGYEPYITELIGLVLKLNGKNELSRIRIPADVSAYRQRCQRKQ